MKLKLLNLFFCVSLMAHAQFWTEKATGFTDASRGINQIVITGPTNVWATAYDGSGGGANVQELTKSNDGGETWTAMTINLGVGTGGLGISNLFALDDNTAWIAAFPNTAFDIGGIWKTVDGGATWSKQASALYNNSASFTNIVYFWDANNGFCQGDPTNGYFEIYTTTDGGNNWTRVPSSGIPAPLTGEYGYVRQIEVVNDRLWYTTNKGRIYRSDDKGHTFTVYQSPLSDFGSATESGNLSFWDENNGLLVSANGQIYKTTNGGTSWTVAGSVDSSNSDVECIEGTSDAIITANDGGSPATSSNYYSTDNGNTWTLIDNTQRIELESGHGLVFAGGFNTDATTGGIFKYTGDVLSNQENTLTSFNAYPNPFNDVLKIDAIDSISKVEIFNLLGQVVLTETPNVSNAEINTANLTSGSYIAKITVNNSTETIKLIK